MQLMKKVIKYLKIRTQSFSLSVSYVFHVVSLAVRAQKPSVLHTAFDMMLSDHIHRLRETTTCWLTFNMGHKQCDFRGKGLFLTLHSLQEFPESKPSSPLFSFFFS